MVGRTASLRAEIVARLVGGDGEKPRAQAAFGIELGSALMNLQEGFLKDVFGGGAVADKADQEVEQLALIAFDKPSETGAVSVSIGLEQLFVGLTGRGFLRHGGRR